MAYSFYRYLGLAHPNATADISILAEKIKQLFENDRREISIANHPTGIIVSIEDYNFKIDWQENDVVLQESKEIAADFNEDYAGRPLEKNQIQHCRKRFEMAGETDNNMHYFNDSLFIAECIEALGNVTVLSLN